MRPPATQSQEISGCLPFSTTLRNHQGLGNRLINAGGEVGHRAGDVHCRERLGGVLRYYYRQARRVKILSSTAISQAEGAFGSSAGGPFRRLTARLPGPKLCLSPQPHGVRHELRPPALATPARHPGSRRHPCWRIAPSLHPCRVGSFPSITRRVVAPMIGSVRAGE
jgi:hypothetical protein